MEWETGLHFYLNGEQKVLLSVDPRMTLLQYIRSEGLSGTKLGCGEGGCGACTVIVSSIEKSSGYRAERHLSGALYEKTTHYFSNFILFMPASECVSYASVLYGWYGNYNH